MQQQKKGISTDILLLLFSHSDVSDSLWPHGLQHTRLQFSSVQFSHSVMSNSLQPHESQHTRPPCPSPTPGVYSNSSLLSRWCHLTILSSAALFFCLQSFPASVSFPVFPLFSVVSMLIYIPTKSTQMFPFPASSPTFVIFRLYDNNHSHTREVISHCSFDLHLPDD